MAQLTEDLFPTLQNRASILFQQQEAKEALVLGREMEKALPPLADNPPLYQKYQTLTFQLKWLGLSLMQDSKEYSELFRRHLLEGLTMPEGDLNGPTQIVALKISFMFGIGVVEFLNETLGALSENNQKIGTEAILVFGEKNFSPPTIKNWLLDFIRSSPEKQALNEISVSNYLFDNTNTEKLLPKNKDLLGKTLVFFCVFQQVNRSLAAMEKQMPLSETTTASRNELTKFHGATSSKDFFTSRSSIVVDESLSSQPAAPTPPTILQKTLRQLVQENKNALYQNLTNEPIKIADFDQPVRPTIKNWLVDYVKIKGAGHHESLERSDYLFGSPNAKSLPENERALVAAILKAYDDDLSLLIDGQNQILLEKLIAPEKPILEQASLPPKTASASQPASPPAPPSNANYREPIAEEDLAGPLKKTLTKPTPKLSGNIIDLKDLQ